MFSTEPGCEQLQTQPKNVAPTLALKWYPQYLIGQANLFDISTANQNQGGKYVFSPRISRLTLKMAGLSIGCAYARIDSNDR